MNRQPTLRSARQTIAATAALIGLTGLILLGMEHHDLTDALERNGLAQAALLAENLDTAVMFEDADEAATLLASLSHVPSVQGTAVFSANGYLAQWGDVSTAPTSLNVPPGQRPRLEHRLEALHVFQPIVVDNRPYGYLWLGLSKRPLYAAMTSFALAAILTGVLSLLIVARMTRRLAQQVDQARLDVNYLSRIDPVTEAPNRQSFDQDFQAALHRQRGVLLAILDLDDFKLVNDTHGHLVGNQLLKAVAHRLVEFGRQAEASVYRLGSDEFAVVFTGSFQGTRMQECLGALQSAVGQRMDVINRRFELRATIGASLYPSDGRSAHALFRKADTALHEAKRVDRGGIMCFTEQMAQAIATRQSLIADLRHALDHDGLELCFQPIVDTRTGCVTSCEALTRWHHPSRGPLSPAVFIPLAEEAGLIGRLGLWSVREGCRIARMWERKHGLTIQMGVNISILQLQDDAFIEELPRVLAAEHRAADDLKLEVTESVLAGSFDRMGEMLLRLRSLGVKISLDDFGTGYSSLAYLPNLPIQQLKIDKSFVDRVPGPDEAVIRAIVTLATHYQMDVVAEGIETAEQARLLTRAGCRHLQGFYFSPAVPADQFPAACAQIVQQRHQYLTPPVADTV